MRNRNWELERKQYGNLNCNFKRIKLYVYGKTEALIDHMNSLDSGPF